MAGSFSSLSTDTREALRLSLLLAAVLAITIATIVMRVDPVRASWFSDVFKLSVDLGQCAPSLARPLIAGTLLALVAGSIATVLLLLSLVELYTSRVELRPHGLLLLGISGLASLLLVPAATGGGTWLNGDAGGLEEACALSKGMVFYRAYGPLVVYAFLAWLAMLAGLVIKQRISSGQPAIRWRTFGRIAKPERTLDDSLVARTPAPLRIVFLSLAAVAIIFYGASLKFSVSRFYHQLTWIEQPTKIAELKSLCLLLGRDRIGWTEVSRGDCSQKEQQEAFSSFVRQDPRRWSLAFRPQAMLEMQLPQGDKMFTRVEGYFFLPPTPTQGEHFILLRDPNNPRKLDRTFDIQDAGKTFGRLLTLAFAMIAIYLLWPHVSSPGRRQSAA